MADAGPLIRFSRLDRLDLLRALFDDLLVPEGVWREVAPDDTTFPGVEAILAARARGWFQVRAVQQEEWIAQLSSRLERGEAEAIALMQETNAHLLLSDDLRARAEAARLGLPLTGTVGLLRLARDRGLIAAAYPLLLQLRRGNFGISDALLERSADEER